MYKQLVDVAPKTVHFDRTNTNFQVLSNAFPSLPQTLNSPDLPPQQNISTDPLTYCMLDSFNSQMLNGPTGKQNGKYSQHCSQFLSNRCAIEWDAACEAVSQDMNMYYPNTGQPVTSQSRLSNLSYGDKIVRDTAFKRFRSNVYDCNLVCTPFDPLVANSPLVCYDTPSGTAIGPSKGTLHFGEVEQGGCKSEYEVTTEQAQQLNQDIVMNKLLRAPWIAPDLLQTMYTTMKNKGTLGMLKGTYLGAYYEQMMYQ